MKKNLFMVAAVALVALTACNKEEVAGGNQDVQPVAPTAVVEFTASFSETKTALNAEGKKTLWVETDRIDINGQEFKIKELVDGGLAAKFENVNELPANFAAPFTAKYPYGVEEVPATQTAYAGTFDPAAVLEIATSDNHNLSFTNVTSLLKFQVPAACQTVTISSDDVLAGSDAKTVTVNGPFAQDETYYAAVLPGTKANFVVRIDGYLSKNAGSVTIDESTIANMKTLPAPKEASVELRGDAPLSWDNGTKFYEDIDCLVLKNVSLTASQGFKILNGSTWLQGALPTDKWAVLKENGGNMKLAAGNYDIYISKTSKVISVVSAGSPSPELIKPESGYMYLLPSDNWLEANAHFAAWIWKDSGAGKLYNFTEHESVKGLYKLKLNDANKMILFRMAPDKDVEDGSSTFPEGDQWHKTGDLSIGTNNLYTVINWHAAGSGLSKVTTLL